MPITNNSKIELHNNKSGQFLNNQGHLFSLSSHRILKSMFLTTSDWVEIHFPRALDHPFQCLEGTIEC